MSSGHSNNSKFVETKKIIMCDYSVCTSIIAFNWLVLWKQLTFWEAYFEEFSDNSSEMHRNKITIFLQICSHAYCCCEVRVSTPSVESVFWSKVLLTILVTQTKWALKAIKIHSLHGWHKYSLHTVKLCTKNILSNQQHTFQGSIPLMRHFLQAMTTVSSPKRCHALMTMKNHHAIECTRARSTKLLVQETSSFKFGRLIFQQIVIFFLWILKEENLRKLNCQGQL